MKKYLVLFACLLGMMNATAGNNYMTLNVPDLRPGITAADEVVLEFSLNNEDGITSVQLDFDLPAGVRVAKNNRGRYIMALSEDREDGHTIGNNLIGTNYRVLIKSDYNDLLLGNSGVLFTVTLETDANLAYGTGSINVSGISIVTPAAVQTVQPDFSVPVNIPAPFAELSTAWQAALGGASVCATITSITVENNATSIPAGAVQVGTNVRAVLNGTALTIYTPNEKIYLPADSKQLFYGLNALRSMDMSRFSAENCTTAVGMFNACKVMTSITLGDCFAENQITKTDYMFNACYALSSVDLSNFATSALVSTNRMFNNCSSLTSVNLTNFSMASVGDMSLMFMGCKKLASVNLSACTSNRLSNVTSMFEGCERLATVNFNVALTQLKTIDRMFYGCAALTFVNMSNWNLRYVTNCADMFTGATSLRDVYVPYINNEAVSIALPNIEPAGQQWYQMSADEAYPMGTTTYAAIVNSMSGRPHLRLARKAVLPARNEFRTEVEALFGAYGYRDVVTAVNFTYNQGSDVLSITRNGTALNITTSEPTIYMPKNSGKVFQNFAKIKTLDLSGATFVEVANLYELVAYCYQLEELNLSSVNIASTQKDSTNNMFTSCSALRKIHAPASMGRMTNPVVLPNSGTNGRYWYQTHGDGVAINDVCYSRLEDVPAGAIIELLAPARVLGSTSVSITAARYASYAPNMDIVVPSTSGLKVFYVDRFTSEEIHFVQLAAGTIVAAGEGLLVFGDAGVTYTFNEAPSATPLAGNKLVGALVDHHFVNEAEAYVLGKKDNVVGFYYNSANSTLRAGKSYLPITTPAAAAAPRLVFQEVQEAESVEDADIATSIEDVTMQARPEGIYTITGQRIMEITTSGFYIIDGEKKYVVK